MIVAASEQQRRQELADFLRTRRARLSPVQVGLPRRARQRTPGLRREDVAELSGLSVTWYTWLEQARGINVSSESLEAIAGALRLNDDERRHLYDLAKPSSLNAFAPSPEHETAANVALVLDSLIPTRPAIAKGKYLNLMAWNRAAAQLFDDFAELPSERMNWGWYVFKYKPRDFFVDWETFARCTLAVIRADYGRYLSQDPTVGVKLVEELRTEVPEFREWWTEHDVLTMPHPHKEFNHPTRGRLIYETTTLHLEIATDTRLLIFAPSVEMD